MKKKEITMKIKMKIKRMLELKMMKYKSEKIIKKKNPEKVRYQKTK